MLTRLSLALAAAAALVSLAACGSSSTSADDASSIGAAAGSAPSGTPSGSAAAKSVTCSYAAAGTAAKPVKAPPSKPTVGGKVNATLETTVGPITLTLDAATAPCTVNSFASLAEQGYFDNTPCHRLTTSGIYVLQCGDPTGTGTGGPGYSFKDELTGHEKYPTATLAMANSGPNTNGSQFFICYGDCSALNSEPNYTVFGEVRPQGLLTAQAVAKDGTVDGSSDGAPKDGVKITGVSWS